MVVVLVGTVASAVVAGVGAVGVVATVVFGLPPGLPLPGVVADVVADLGVVAGVVADFGVVGGVGGGVEPRGVDAVGLLVPPATVVALDEFGRVLRDVVAGALGVVGDPRPAGTVALGAPRFEPAGLAAPLASPAPAPAPGGPTSAASADGVAPWTAAPDPVVTPVPVGSPRSLSLALAVRPAGTVVTCHAEGTWDEVPSWGNIESRTTSALATQAPMTRVQLNGASSLTARRRAALGRVAPAPGVSVGTVAAGVGAGPNTSGSWARPWPLAGRPGRPGRWDAARVPGAGFGRVVDPGAAARLVRGMGGSVLLTTPLCAGHDRLASGRSCYDGGVPAPRGCLGRVPVALVRGGQMGR